MRASRLLSILLLLQTRGRLTAQQLADRMEVSVRTIYRDIDALSAAGVPVYGEAGPSGGFQLLDGYETRLTGLTEEEAEALPFAGMAGPAAELGLGGVLAAAQLKIHAALPAELRDRTERIAQRFHLDAPGWYQEGDRSPHLAAVAEAVWNQHRVQLRYHRWKEPTDIARTLEPYGLVLKAGTWYLVARGSEHLGTYRVNQIQHLTVLNEKFARHDEFDLATYWNESVVEFRSRLYTGEATVRLSPAGRLRLRDLFTSAVVQAVDRTMTKPGPDGWVTAVAPIESIRHAHSEFLRLGAHVEVTAPAALRRALSASARALVALYNGHTDVVAAQRSRAAAGSRTRRPPA